MKKRINIPKPTKILDMNGKMSILKNCEPLEDHAEGFDAFMCKTWLHDYDPKQDIVFTWSYEGTDF